MASTPRRGILAALLLGAAAFGPAVLGAGPAAAFSLFGIHLWGEQRPVDEPEIIDPRTYTVTLRVAGGDGGLQKKLEAASALWTDRETPASGNAGLLSKARGDYRRLLAALYGEGYYGAAISIRAAGREVSDITLAVDFPPNVPIAIDVQAGPPFTFGVTRIVNRPPEVVPQDDSVATPASIGFATGAPALSGVVGQASALSIQKWRQLSRAKARETDREVIADHDTDRLDVTLTLDPGQRAHYGPTRVEGSRRVDPGFIAFMADLPEGRSFDPDDIADAQARLSRLGIFRSLRVQEADSIGPDGSLPMTVEVEDRKRRTVGFGATLSTLDGIGVATYWQNRNLFGRAESLRFDASINGLGFGFDPSSYDYNFGLTFTKPGVYTPDTSFVASAAASQLDYDTYRERSVTGRVGLSQMFGRRLTGEGFAVVQRARFDDAFGIRNFTTFALSGRAQYDRRNDPLNATEGYYLAGEVQPFYEAVFGNAAFRGTLDGRGYLGFGADDKFVLAGRAVVGTYLGPTAAESPPDLLFFAGGGGSVRGYAYQSIGVETVLPGDTEPSLIGGRGLFLASGELRYRINKTFGAVGFVDSGYVAENANFSGASDLRTGAGLGLRYFTSIGVLRADLAAPLDPRAQDSAVALYLGIGQAF